MEYASYSVVGEDRVVSVEIEENGLEGRVVSVDIIPYAKCAPSRDDLKRELRKYRNQRELLGTIDEYLTRPMHEIKETMTPISRSLRNTQRAELPSRSGRT